MKKKSIQKKKYWQSFLHKYRLTVLNEQTLEEVFHFRLSKCSFYGIILFVILFMFCLYSAIFLYTPMKQLTPNYADRVVRTELFEEIIRLDSLQQSVEMQKKQMGIIKQILSGNLSPDSLQTATLDSGSINYDFIGKTQRELIFSEIYEEKEKYNLSSIEPKQTEQVPVFFRPVQGIVTKNFAPGLQHYGCDIVTSPNEPVVSIYTGIVIMAELTVPSEFTIAILHNNGYVSIYKRNAKLLKNIGDEVKTGEVIAIVSGNKDETSEPYMHFELWKDNCALNPTEYISF